MGHHPAYGKGRQVNTDCCRDSNHPGSAQWPREMDSPALSPDDTIAAVATPPGRGGIGIVRLSGPSVQAIAQAILEKLPTPRMACLQNFLDSDARVIDTGIVLFFPAPHSFTGEDVLELQGHGGPMVQDLLLQRITALGARLARPGEFSERAFLNDRLDLAQAEAIADLIDAGSAQAVRSAQRSLAGEFSRQVHALRDALVELRVYVEAAIDFPEEEIDFITEGHVMQRVVNLLAQLDSIAATAQQGRLLRDGLTVVLAGATNVGKSSVLNRLIGHDAAIVTDMPGTTRDVLREQVHVDGMPLHIIDTAGLRTSDDSVEQEGMRRTREQLRKADFIIHVVDDTRMHTDDSKLLKEFPDDIPVIDVLNKIDISGRTAGLVDGSSRPTLAISALAGTGFDSLRRYLKDAMGYQDAAEGAFSARRRHIDALARARKAIAHGLHALEASAAGELLAEDLRQAQQTLGEITGEFSNDDLLGEIFSSFCIGK